MVLHGTVDGSLADCMFGTFAPSNQAWMWRSSHINDRLDDARILATVREPTQSDPFRFLGIKWFAKEHPAVLSGIIQQRDFLIMEATGLTRDSKGEIVGYYLMHSVSLPEVPELSDMGIVRGNVSLCFIDRQSGPGKVELYCRGFSDPCGAMLDRVSVAIASEALICAAGVVDYAYIKKLMWLVKYKGVSQQREHGREPGFTRATRCDNCWKIFTKFGLTGLGPGAPCHICRRVVCAKCSVVKKMTVDVSDTGSVKQCSLRFCVGCLLEATKKSVWELALSGVETSSRCSSNPSLQC
ncbi:tRNA (guanine(26)-N(2))-dimethyltransferase [Phytophthora cinnamomi]|uniref:tRNA (guanine(26)-N(2))-dimethyltransferase n=1 Tax=Phytophthora cinnamomi TaxID=4785 RepID=UPI00355A11FD|nr:tRNA (guanine(26)-N(2))-dimethyltransferase [Phytophthora cinnamomi]